MKAKQFNSVLVRDLAWVMRSQVMLKSALNSTENGSLPQVVNDAFCQSISQANQPWLQAQDIDPEPLKQWMEARKSHRLGYYFEALIEYWLQHLVDDGVLFTRVPVRQGEQTLGEFDFLFAQSRAEVLNHWEVAVKFYLHHPASGSDNSGSDKNDIWYGPGARDRFDKKVSHLVEQQSRLAETVQGHDAIQSLDLRLADLPVRSHIMMKGYLFYPSDTDWRHPAKIPDEASLQHLTGWWTRVDNLQIPEVQVFGKVSQSRWCLLPKLRWLSPVLIAPEQTEFEDSIPDTDLMTRAQLADACGGHFVDHSESLLIAEMQANDDGVWKEVTRGFVVGKDWPN